MQVDLREFRAAYLAEVDEHLAAVDAGLLEIEAGMREGASRPRAMRDVMRMLHTIKGLSGMVGVEPIVVIAHHMETVLRGADSSGGVVRPRALEVLILGAQAIQTRVRSVAKDEAVEPPPDKLMTELLAASGETPSSVPQPMSSLDPELDAKLNASEREQVKQAAAKGLRVVRMDFAPSPERAARGLTITSLRERAKGVGEIVKVVPLATTASAAAPGGLVFVLVLVTTKSDDAIAAATELEIACLRELAVQDALILPPLPDFETDVDVPDQRSGVLRVDVARIDDAIEKLSALIVTRSRLSRVASELRAAGVATRELDLIVTDSARQLRDLRASILRVRMIPIAVVLDRLPFVVRGLGKSTGKLVRLVLEGGAAELDKTVAERIFPALVHLLRNAVDHGIESPEERSRSGKPAEATITIHCISRANRIEVRVSDDGRGVDRAAVAAKARREVPTDDATLLELLCRSGLSTRSEVDTTSGRGVGMDIVKKVVVDQLGGELMLETVAGSGTTFTLRVPLTIAIVDAFTLSCGGSRFVVPVPVVEEIVEVDHAKLVHGPRVRGRDLRFFPRRGEAVPLIDLAEVLGMAGTGAKAAQALVVRRGHDVAMAFAIDRILGQQETVVRPLVDPLVAGPGVSGTTDLGDGHATLVLDLLGLSTKLAREESAA